MSETLFEGKVDELKSADPELIVPSPNGNRVAVVMPSGTVSLWNVVTESRLLQLDGASAAAVSIDHEDARVAAVNREHAISIYRILDGQLEKSLIPNEMSRDTYCRGLAFSPDGSQLISRGGMCLSLWEIRKPTLLWQRKSRFYRHTDAVCSPEGTLIASGAVDHTVRLTRTTDGEIQHELKGHTTSSPS